MTDPSKCRMNWNSRTTYGKTGISQNCNSEISNGYIQDVHMEYQSGDIIQNIIPHECNERIICQTKEMIPRNVVTTCSEKKRKINKYIFYLKTKMSLCDVTRTSESDVFVTLFVTF